jgi:hypothetical protein
LKDVQQGTPSSALMTMSSAALGEGRINWPALLAVATEARIECAYVERESPFQQSPLTAIASDLQYLRSLGAGVC